jgi:outer membrane receptor for ferrienterochelin and colicins
MRDWRIECLLTADLGPSHTLVAGTDFLQNQADYDPIVDAGTKAALPGSTGEDEEISNLGIFLQDEIRLGEKVRLVPGVRFDSHSEFDTVASPKIACSYTAVGGTVVRASIGSAFRAPTLSEMFYPDWMVAPGVTLVSNPDLEPERITAYDIGLEHSWPGGVTVRADLFLNDMDDLISLQTAAGVMTYVNVSEATSQGIEVGLDWYATEHIGFSMDYTRQHTEDEDMDEDLDYMPENKVGLGARLHGIAGAWKLAFSLNQMFVDERVYRDRASNLFFELDSYWRIDVALKARRRNGWVEVTVRNLTNEDYEETGGDLAPATMVVARAGLTF